MLETNNSIEIFNTLRNLDISETEYLILKILFSLNSGTVMQISKLTQIPRSTVHQNIDSLINKGLIHENIKHKKRYLVPSDLNAIDNLVKQKIIKTEEEKVILENTLGNLHHIKKDILSIAKLETNPDTKLAYYKGKKAVFNLYSEMVKSKIVYSYANADWIQELMPEVTKLWSDSLEQGKLKSFDLLIRTSDNFWFVDKLAKFDSYKYKEIKYIEYLYGVDYSIFNNKIAMIQVKSEPEAIVIEDPMLYQHAKATFLLLWDLL